MFHLYRDFKNLNSNLNFEDDEWILHLLYINTFVNLLILIIHNIVFHFFIFDSLYILHNYLIFSVSLGIQNIVFAVLLI